MFTILFALLLAAISPTSAPSHTTTGPTVSTAGYVPKCPCSIGLKDWGK